LKLFKVDKEVTMKYPIALLSAVLTIAAPAQAADWRACRAKKVEVVRLEQALGAGKKLKGYASGAAMKKARRAKEDWLWKHCRSYSRRLRDVERDMM
jgi:hypothetical protein|tara:strand:+ start:10443 stop:10733 length:291 start_codon:yes stop_codon:yes gene_type:complete